ncbi:MAG: CHASE2 domain-containing protein [Pararhodobacter sp.]
MALAALILGLLIGLRVVAPQPFLDLRGMLHDSLQRAFPRADLPVPVAVVDIDDASLERLGQWPWPRDVIAALIEALSAQGAVAIALDIVFAEPDRGSPRHVFDEWRARGLADLLVGTATPPDFDELLEETLSRNPVVLGYALTAQPDGSAPRRVPGVSVIGPDPGPALLNFPGSVRNLSALEAAAAGNGHFSAPTGAGVIRSLPMLALHEGVILPSLSIEALRVAQRRDTLALRTMPRPLEGASSTPPMALRVGAIDIPLSQQGEYALHFRRSDPSRMIPAWQVLAATDDTLVDLRPRLAGHVVFVGTSAAGLADLRRTPMNPSEPGVNIHAQALEQILVGHHLLRPLWAAAAELGTALLLAALAATAAQALAVVVGLTMVAGLGLGLLAGTVLALSHGGMILDPVLPLGSMLLVFAAGLIQRMLHTERSRRQLRTAFSHYLAPEMVRRLAEHPERLVLGGEEREMTFLFTDLEGFTRFAESLPPTELAQVLNRYLGGLCAIVMEHGGTIDKIVGDAVHAMFNAPLSQSDHADRAVKCALALDAFAEAFRQQEASAGRPIGCTRIGVNSGRAVVGNFGGAGRFDYTAHGDAINVAARLEAANTHLGTRICVAASTATACVTSRFRPIGRLLLKGKSVPVACFEPLVAEDARTQSYRVAYERMAGGDGAAMLAHAAHFANDALAHCHAERLKAAGPDGIGDVIAAR